MALVEEGKVEFDLEVEGMASSLKIELPLPGRYNVYNALAAISVGISLGIDLEGIKEGLRNFELTELRNKVSKVQGGD